MGDDSHLRVTKWEMLRPLFTKTWLETRSRFLIGLVAVAGLCLALVLWQGPLRARLSLGTSRAVPDTVVATLAYAEYIHRFLYAGAVQPLGQLVALILAMGGLQREREIGTTALTLALPVRRRDLVGARAVVGIVQVTVVALVPAVLIPILSPLVGESYSASQALGFFALWVPAHTIIFSAALLVSTVVPSQMTALLIAWLVLLAHSAVALIPALQPFKLSLGWIATGVGMSYFDPVTSLLSGCHGPA